MIQKAFVVAILASSSFLLPAFGESSIAASDPPPPPPAAAGQKPSAEHVRQLLHDGAWSDAESEARRLLAEVESASGGDSPETARALDLVVEALWRGKKARNPEARALAQRAVSIKERSLGKDHPDLVVSLKNLGNVCYLSDDLDAASTAFRRMIALAESTLGPENREVANGLNNLGAVEFNRGNYTEVLSIGKRALSIYLASAAPDDPILINVLNNLANSAAELGHFGEARDYLERALGISRAHFPPGHPTQAPLLSNLADLVKNLGDYEKAVDLYSQALEIRKKTYGEESEIVAITYYNLSEAWVSLGDFASARALLERSLEIYRKLLGPDHLLVADSLTNLGILLSEMGDYASALPLQERALEVMERSASPGNAVIGDGLQALAHTQKHLGEIAKAEALYRRALAVYEKAFGPEHPRIAATLGELASLKVETGDRAEARTLFVRALAMATKLNGPDHPDVAQLLDDLGHLLLMEGDHDLAREDLEKGLAIREKVLGPDHPLTGRSLMNLAQLHLAIGRVSESLDESLRSQAILRAHFQRTARYLSEREALTYESEGPSALDIALSALSRKSPAPPPEAAEQVWNELVKSRAMVLDEMASRHLHSPDEGPEIASLRQSLKQVKRRVASLALQGPDSKQPEAYRIRLSELRDEAERQERLLADKNAVFRSELAQGSVSLRQLRDLLPGDAALAAYVQYERLLPPLLLDGKPGPPPESVPSYGVFLLRAGRDRPQFIPLAAGAEIEKLVKEWRTEISLPPPGLPVAASAVAPATEAGIRLRKAVWDPLAKRLRGARRVFLVPDGALNLVSFYALPGGRGDYLVESGPFVHFLSAERDLLLLASPLPETTKAFLLGGPDYDSSPDAPSAPRTRAAVLSSPAPDSRPGSLVYRSPASSCPDLKGLRFDPLPMAAEEVSELKAIVSGNAGRAIDPRSVLELTGADASESAFKARAPGCGILHLATHSFLLGSACPSPLDRAAVNSPLLLSGLALAGANRRAEVTQCADCEDGILTAEEIASLDLSGAEWVVLSACETGVGKVMAGEGVFGLRRAFQVAGARTLIMSLWKVEDEGTRDWMRRLYQARVTGMSTAEAVRSASLDVLRDRRARGLSTHPFYWGAFVASGDYR